MKIPSRLVVLAPNWLGDAVMALPLIGDLHRAWPETTIVVAARSGVAPLFAMVPGVSGTLLLDGGGWRAVTSAGADSRLLAAGTFDAALLLPNSFAAAWMARRAGIAERWGIARDFRGALLTRSIRRPKTYGHQVEYYQAIGAALAIPVGDAVAAIRIPAAAQSAASDLLRESGVAEGRRVVVLAPGAAYGRAKQWLPERFAELSTRLAGEGTSTVLVGAHADRGVCQEIARRSAAIDLAGRTDLAALAAVMSQAGHVVTNDSGAMHLAAAAGARVTAIFGPTNDRRTSPLRPSASAAPATIVTADVWCRPCMLRECPIDHRCMARITAEQVYAEMRR